jgi:hypothetical protein
LRLSRNWALSRSWREMLPLDSSSLSASVYTPK